MVLPDPFLRPRITPTTPVRPMPVTTSSQPNSRSLSATMPAVRWTSYRSSGCSWKSCRQAAISSVRAAMRLTMGMGDPRYATWSGLSEHALEDRVDVFEVIAEVELLVDLGIGEVFLHLGVLLQERIEVAFAAPDRHRVALDQLVGIFAARALLRQRDQGALGVDQAAEPVEALLHVGGVDPGLVDQGRQTIEREVEGDGGIRPDHALGRGVRDIALVPEHDVLQRRRHIGAHHAREAGEILRQHRVALVRHGGRALLALREELF